MGLQSAAEFREKRKNLHLEEEQEERQLKTKKKKKKKPKNAGLLSFDDLDEEPLEPPKGGSLKNPTVPTDFLPDRARELAQAKERRRLEAEWKEQQEQLKQELVKVIIVIGMDRVCEYIYEYIYEYI